MAAEYFRDRAARAGLSHVAVGSAGTLGIEGAPASAEAVEILREHGLDLTTHRSRGLRPSEVATADLIVAMELEHMDILERRFPRAGEKSVLLRAFEMGPEAARTPPDLEDPMGQPLETYRKGFERIRDCIDGLILHLRHAP